MYTAPILIMSLQAIILGALRRRVAGGLLLTYGLSLPSFLLRVVYGISLSTVAYLAGVDFELYVLITPLIVSAMYLSEIIGDATLLSYNFNHITTDAVLLMFYACCRKSLLVFAFLSYGYTYTLFWMLIPVFVAPLAFMMASVYPIKADWLGCVKLKPYELYSWPTFELIWGGSFGLGIFLTTYNQSHPFYSLIKVKDAICTLLLG